ncbi:hypothetical protein [Thermotoga sp. KOL6]|uniref:hypothetical protein n=1 Tax=Thermotoga sp. KOL6 TaxID=126741 RepID=UPI000C76CC94|nr:hypothetical protein [Thermotoga sp. KOL6]PLV59883.1 hypothetical protein AS005_00875 [Thermotoga sp. KOL6]
MTPLRVNILDLDGVYEGQTILKSLASTVVSAKMKGVRYMLLPEKLIEMEKLISGLHGIIFLGDSEYHHFTYLFIKKLKEPFVLLVFDNHFDAAEGEILACDNWIRKGLKLKNLRRVIVVGCRREEKKHRVLFVEADPLKIKKVIGKYPVYLSIDKDVLTLEVTKWGKGQLPLESFLEIILSIPKRKILGVDICGEPDPTEIWKIKESERVNLSILSALLFDESNYKSSRKHLEWEPAYVT